jgi:hypothetical protein
MHLFGHNLDHDYYFELPGLAVEWTSLEKCPKVQMVSGERRRDRVVGNTELARYLTCASPLLADVATLLGDCVPMKFIGSTGQTSGSLTSVTETCPCGTARLLRRAVGCHSLRECVRCWKHDGPVLASRKRVGVSVTDEEWPHRPQHSQETAPHCAGPLRCA